MQPQTPHPSNVSGATTDVEAPESAHPVVTIGIDAAEAEGRPTGVGRYTIEIVRRWIERGSPDRRYVLFARQRKALPAELRRGAEVVTGEADVSTPEREGVVRWQQFRLPGLLRRRPVDVLFSPAYAVPLRTNTPCVVALHDLSFERFPEEFRFKERWRRRILARLAARRAARVLTISQFSAHELLRLYRLAPDRVSVSYPGVDRFQFRPAPEPSPSRPARPFFLTVGTFLRRRHLDVLVQSFSRLPAAFDEHELVLVGSDRAQPPLRLSRLAGACGVGERVRIVDHVSDEDLVNLYRTTDLHISLSAYEGFGLPAAEGLAAGAPTLLLDQPVYRELWDGCAHFVDAEKVDSAEHDAVAGVMAEASGKVLDQDQVGHRLETLFDWERCAAEVDTVLCDAAAHGPRVSR